MLRATAQLFDRAMLGALWRSALWAALALVALGWGLARAVAAMVPAHTWLGTVAGTVGAALAAYFLFVPFAVGISACYVERIARAVERRWYPLLPPARGASVAAQGWDAAVLGLRILAYTLLALGLSLLLPGIGIVIGWAVSAWAIGRGLYVTVAMRRMDRPAATRAYLADRPMVLMQGALLAALGFVPLLNLLVPVLGIAAMVHVAERGAGTARWQSLAASR